MLRELAMKGLQFIGKCLKGLFAFIFSVICNLLITALVVATFPFFIAALSYEYYSVYESFMNAYQVPTNHRRSFLAFVTVPLASPFILLGGAILALVGNLVLPFASCVIAFKRGFTQAPFPVLLIMMLDAVFTLKAGLFQNIVKEIRSYAETILEANQRNQPESKENPQLEIKAANRALHRKIEELPETQRPFPFLTENEIKALEEVKGTSALLAQYKVKLNEINKKHQCVFYHPEPKTRELLPYSNFRLEEMKSCLTIEYKTGRRSEYIQCSYDNFLAFVSTRSADAMAYIPGVWRKINGLTIQANAREKCLKTHNDIKIYKGFHKEVTNTLERELRPILNQLRETLPKQEFSLADPKGPGMWPSQRQGGQVLNQRTSSVNSRLDPLAPFRICPPGQPLN